MRGPTPSALLVNLILVYSTLLDFVIACTTVNRFVVAALRPGDVFDWSFARSLKWALLTAPVFLLAVAMALFIPRLDSLTGLLNSLTGTTLQLTGPALCVVVAKRQSAHEARLAKSLVVFGVALTVLIFSQTFYSIFWLTDYSAGRFWCDVVG